MEPAVDIDSYIETFPRETQKLLQELRILIQKTAPEAIETISYAMPAFKMKKMLVYFAGYKNHIGLYPGAATILHFQNEIQQFKNAKGSVQFPLDKPLPIDLIKKMVEFKLKETKQ